MFTNRIEAENLQAKKKASNNKVVLIVVILREHAFILYLVFLANIH